MAGILDDHGGPSSAGCEPALGPVTVAEIALLDRLVPDRAACGRVLSAYVVNVARLGGYLARPRDPPPGNLVMWRSFARLADIVLGSTFARASPDVGNRKRHRALTIEPVIAKLKSILSAEAARTVSDLLDTTKREFRCFSTAECRDCLAAVGYDA